MSLTHINPATMHDNPVYSQGVLLDAGTRLLIVGGQNGVDATGAVVGPDLGDQSVQALKNLLTVLEAAGATQADVAKLTIYLVAGSDINAAFAAAQQVWTQRTAVTVVQVAALGRPDCLVEIEALAQVAA